MLCSLSIRDIVLIDRLNIEFDGGLTVLTGETGAGKSILLDALSLALGGRGDGGLVRAGQPQGQIIASFDARADHAVRTLLRENDIEDDGDVILKRVQTTDGRTRAFINDCPVSVSLLRDVGRELVEIHGQHADRALIDPESHRDILDTFGDLSEPALKVRHAFADWKLAAKTLRDHEKSIETARQEFDYLTASVAELEALGPEAGEEEKLAERRQAMMAHEKVADDLSEAFDTLNGPGSPIPVIANLWRRLERKDEIKTLIGSSVDALGRALDDLEDARGGIETAIRSSDYDANVLEQVEERLFALRAAGRKFSVSPDILPNILEAMRTDLHNLESGEDRLRALQSDLTEKRRTLDAAALALSQQRRKAAQELEAAVASELPDLKLERAQFLVKMETNPDEPQVSGIDSIEFWVQTNPGTKPGPIMKVASGGELSRFLLALKVSIAERGSAPTLVFDEIDTGVGGAVAEAIGIRLERLSRSVQVLSVTHAPQVAARAGEHMLIRKDEMSPEQVATRIGRLDADTRREEIARMLAGAKITDEARAAAARLLEGVG